MPLLEWFANSYKKFGATLEIVTDKSQEGSQFVKGFGGIGGERTLNLDLFINEKLLIQNGITVYFFPKYVSLLGILRYRVDFQGMDYQGEDEEFFDLDDYQVVETEREKNQ